MANVGLALYYGMPGVMDIQERARRMRLAEQQAPLERQQLEQNIEQGEMQTQLLAEKVKQLKAENEPIPMDTINKHILTKTIHEGGVERQLVSSDPNLVTIKSAKDVFAHMDKKENQEWWAGKIRSAIDPDTPFMKELNYGKRELERVQGVIAKNQKIVDSDTATTEEKMKAMKENEKEQEYMKERGLQEGYTELKGQYDDVVRTLIGIDKTMKTQKIVEDNMDIIRTKPKEEQQHIVALARIGDVEGLTQKFRDWAKNEEITSNISDTGYYITKSGNISNIKAGSKPHERNVSTALLSWMKAAEKDALLATGTKQSIISRLMQAYDTGNEQAIQSAMLAATGGMSSEQKASYDKKKDSFMRNRTPQDIREAYIKITPEASTTPIINITEGHTATNPKTGQKIIFKGGKWQPLK